jgi:hypothetical protein
MKIRLATALLVVSTTASAYPSSVVFSPNGEARPIGTVGVLAYSATNLAPSVSAGSSWFGLQAGLLSQWSYGKRGLSFGGLEAGADLITPFGGGVAKPVFNLKASLITEGTYSPSAAVGVMELSPALASMGLVYVAATKTLRASPEAFAYGRVTLGFGVNAGSRATFEGTAPFHPGARFVPMAAYESPLLFRRLGAVVDYLGGASEVGDTYLGVAFAATPVTTLGAGAFRDNERQTRPADGLFLSLTTSVDLTRAAP